jgi:hypothetical protein
MVGMVYRARKMSEKVRKSDRAVNWVDFTAINANWKNYSPSAVNSMASSIRDPPAKLCLSSREAPSCATPPIPLSSLGSGLIVRLRDLRACCNSQFLCCLYRALDITYPENPD